MLNAANIMVKYNIHAIFVSCISKNKKKVENSRQHNAFRFTQVHSTVVLIIILTLLFCQLEFVRSQNANANFQLENNKFIILLDI